MCQEMKIFPSIFLAKVLWQLFSKRRFSVGFKDLFIFSNALLQSNEADYREKRMDDKIKFTPKPFQVFCYC